MATEYYKKPSAASWSDYHRARKYHRRKWRGQSSGDLSLLDLYWRYHGKVFQDKELLWE